MLAHRSTRADLFKPGGAPIVPIRAASRNEQPRPNGIRAHNLDRFRASDGAPSPARGVRPHIS